VTGTDWGCVFCGGPTSTPGHPCPDHPDAECSPEHGREAHPALGLAAFWPDLYPDAAAREGA
jgi:hypothetical protein